MEFVAVITDQYSYLPGDANNDGEVNIADVSLIVDILLGAQVDPATLERSDVNKDGEVNIADVSKVIDFILGR